MSVKLKLFKDGMLVGIVVEKIKVIFVDCFVLVEKVIILYFCGLFG